MIFRRIAVFAVACVLALAPGSGHALGEEVAPIAGTDCTVGPENLTYDKVGLDWTASSNIVCETTKTQLALSVSAVLVQAGRNSVAIPESGITCLACPAIQQRVHRGSPWMTAGLYQVAAKAYVAVEGRPWMVADHYSCFLVREFEVRPLLAGCPKIN